MTELAAAYRDLSDGQRREVWDAVFASPDREWADRLGRVLFDEIILNLPEVWDRLENKTAAGRWMRETVIELAPDRIRVRAPRQLTDLLGRVLKAELAATSEQHERHECVLTPAFPRRARKKVPRVDLSDQDKDDLLMLFRYLMGETATEIAADFKGRGHSEDGMTATRVRQRLREAVVWALRRTFTKVFATLVIAADRRLKLDAQLAEARDALSAAQALVSSLEAEAKALTPLKSGEITR